MELTVTIPATAERQASIRIDRMDIDSHNRRAHVSYVEDGVMKVKEVDLQTIIDQATQDQLDAIALFFRAIVANTLGIAIIDVPDTIWL